MMKDDIKIDIYHPVSENCNIIPLNGIDREEWLQLRKDCLGGSDAGVILGLSKYASPYSLWAEKTGIYTPEPAGSAAQWGNDLEDVVAKVFARETGLRVVKWNVMLKSKARPWASANVDFWVSDDPCFEEGQVTEWGDPDGRQDPHEPPNLTSIVECKTSAIVTHGTNHLWAEDAVPETYQAQGAHYCIVTGLRSVYFAALLGGEGFVTRHLEWEEETLEGLSDQEDEFWNNHVVTGDPPPVDETDATAKTLDQQYPKHEAGKAIDGGLILAELWDEYTAESELATRHYAKKQELKSKIQAIIKDGEVGTDGERKLMTYKMQDGKKGVDAELLAQKYPEVYAEVYRKGKPFRVMRKAGKNA